MAAPPPASPRSSLGTSDNNDAGGKEGCDGAQQPLPELQRANDEGLTAQIMAARMAKDVAAYHLQSRKIP